MYSFSSLNPVVIDIDKENLSLFFYIFISLLAHTHKQHI